MPGHRENSPNKPRVLSLLIPCIIATSVRSREALPVISKTDVNNIQDEEERRENSSRRGENVADMLQVTWGGGVNKLERTEKGLNVGDVSN